MTKNGLIYLDYAAATPLDERVLKAMLPYLSQHFYNPSAGYLTAQMVAKDIAEARNSVANWLGSRSNEVVFTAGGTEANNLAIHGVMRQFPEGNIVVSAVEHESVIAPARQYDVRIAPVLPDGRIDLEKLQSLIDERTVLVSVMQANNEIGTIQPVREIAQFIRQLRTARGSRAKFPLYLHSDACQAAAYLSLQVSRLGVDLLTINAGKIYGPKQCGALYVRTGTKLQPQVQGGGQEGGLRSGSENVASIMGFAAALDIVQTRRNEEVQRLQVLQKLFFGLLKEQLPAAVINGSLKRRLPNNVHITLPDLDNERLLVQLEGRGILCAAGSACSAVKGQASHVLAALGLDASAARASLRLTMGRSTTAAAVRRTVNVLQELQAEAKALY